MESVIIEASDRLTWHRRLASELATAALWGGWLWLWAPLLEGAGLFARLAPHVPAALKALPAAGPTLPLSVAAIAGTVALRALPRPEAKTAAALPVSDYARRFGLPAHVIEAGRGATVCVVHHDADGRIAAIESRAPAPQAAAA
jgi:poly-beta-1,6-N-acetyl-D-glucosamine biosynthesis protein PgaD